MDDEVCAVRRDTDLRRHARELHRSHDAVLAGGLPAVEPRGVVARSWARMRDARMDPDRDRLGPPASVNLLEQRRRATPLVGVLDDLRTSLVGVAEQAEHLMVITDADGMLLWRDGCPRVRRRADALGFGDGADWSESAVGTNAIGTALVEAVSVQLFSAEHYARSLHSWTCTAVPIHDPRTGELLGVVDLSGSAATAHPTTVALVGTAVRLAEAHLWRAREEQLGTLRRVAASVLSGVDGSALVVDDDGWVAAAVGIAPVDRVSVPAEGELMVVAGLGSCVPERLPGGWLLRPGAGGGVAPRLRLRTDRYPPEAVIEGTSTWRCPVTARQAELLALLIGAGPGGMDAAALSVALFGDRAHTVAVRAEISRLRRRLGGVLSARPYRIASNVRVQHEASPT